MLEELKDGPGISKFKANVHQTGATGAAVFSSIEEWDKHMSDIASGSQDGAGVTGATVQDLVQEDVAPRYADELLPFDITITMANEYGNKASTVLYGVEILNEGTGFSVDAPTSERAYTFVCRSVDTIKAIKEGFDGFISTTW